MKKPAVTSVHALSELVQSRRLIVCVGSGGVGKTTSAAAIGLEAAREGKRVLVITIDPARRLANALGLESIGNRETRIAPEVFSAAGIEVPGSLHAMMLDTRTTFDDLIARVAPDEQTRERVLNNNIYRQIAGAISTAQEYMASEKLYDVYTRGDFDLIVLDTPPMKNALDFLEAPHRFVRFLDDKIINWFVRPIGSEGGFIGKRLMLSTGAVAYKLLGYIFGSEFLVELNEFFLAFKEMTKGFQVRSEQVAEILRSSSTAFLIVCGPGRASVEDARHFSTELRSRSLPEGGIIVNQVRDYEPPPFSNNQVLSPEELSYLNRTDGATTSILPRLEQNYRWLYRRSEQDRRAVAELRRLGGGRGIFQVVPRMLEEINDIPGLLRLNRFLFAVPLNT